MMNIFDVQMCSKGFKLFLRYTIRAKIVEWSAFCGYFFASTIKRYKKIEFGPHLSEISHIKFVSTIKLNTFKVNGPLSADIFLSLPLKSTQKWCLAHNFRKKLKIFFSSPLKRTKNKRLVRFVGEIP